MTADAQLADRDVLDTEVRELVLDAYRAARSSVANPKAKFDAALECYCELAGRLKQDNVDSVLLAPV